MSKKIIIKRASQRKIAERQLREAVQKVIAEEQQQLDEIIGFPIAMANLALTAAIPFAIPAMAAAGAAGAAYTGYKGLQALGLLDPDDPKCPVKGMIPGPNKAEANPNGCYWPKCPDPKMVKTGQKSSINPMGCVFPEAEAEEKLCPEGQRLEGPTGKCVPKDDDTPQPVPPPSRGRCAKNAGELKAGTHILKKGCRGAMVQVLQGDLNDWNKLTSGGGAVRVSRQIAVDGAFGGGTKAAVVEFQKYHNAQAGQHGRLGVDGIVGEQTWTALKAGLKSAPAASEEEWARAEAGKGGFMKSAPGVGTAAASSEAEMEQKCANLGKRYIPKRMLNTRLQSLNPHGACKGMAVMRETVSGALDEQRSIKHEGTFEKLVKSLIK